METIEPRIPELNTAEWELLLQLLEREDALLPVEISHSVTRRMREELRSRMTMVEQISAKIRSAVPQSAGSLTVND